MRTPARTCHHIRTTGFKTSPRVQHVTRPSTVVGHAGVSGRLVSNAEQTHVMTLRRVCVDSVTVVAHFRRTAVGRVKVTASRSKTANVSDVTALKCFRIQTGNDCVVIFQVTAVGLCGLNGVRVRLLVVRTRNASGVALVRTPHLHMVVQDVVALTSVCSSDVRMLV